MSLFACLFDMHVNETVIRKTETWMSVGCPGDARATEEADLVSTEPDIDEKSRGAGVRELL